MSRIFNPIELWPARVGTQIIPVTAVNVSKLGGATGYDENGKVVAVSVPANNTAYARTVRRHEALHAIYSHPVGREDNGVLTQALEDARIHYNHSRAHGSVRRDEIVTALTDLKHGARDVTLRPLLVLRSAAILGAKTKNGVPPQYQAIYQKRCAEISPGFARIVDMALAAIAKEDMTTAERLLRPHFISTTRCETFPNINKSEGKPKKTPRPKKTKPEKSEPSESEPSESETSESETSESETSESEASESEASESEASESDDDVIGAKEESKDFNSTVSEKIIIADVESDLMSKATRDRLQTCPRPPKMVTHDLAAFDNIPTFFGETEKLVPSGSRIKAKKLATIVGPGIHRVFTKTLNLRGGSILIDASGSMRITTKDLLHICQTAPMATLAFYNAPVDGIDYGNLWIFANKARRAADLSMAGPEVRGTGNVIDLLALQWLLKQPAPRYFVTDRKWTGHDNYIAAVTEVFDNAIERKLIRQVWSEASKYYRDSYRTLAILDHVIMTGGKCRTVETIADYYDELRRNPAINPHLAFGKGFISYKEFENLERNV